MPKETSLEILKTEMEAVITQVNAENISEEEKAVLRDEIEAFYKAKAAQLRNKAENKK